MKVVIAGGTSTVGRALEAALRTSCQVITAGRTGCELEFDLTWPLERMSLPDEPDVIVHTAAHFGGKSSAEILAAEEINVLGTMKLCQAAARAKARHFIFVSSIFATLREDQAQFGAYALSKRHAEEVARYICSMHSLPLTVLRPSQIYGAGARFREHQPFLHSMIDRAKNGDDVLLYGSHDPRRNFIHIDDLTAVISKVVSKRIVGTYACQHPEDVTYSQIAKAAFRVFGAQGSVRFLSDKPDIPDNVFAADNALYELIGYQPNTTIEDGIRRIAALS